MNKKIIVAVLFFFLSMFICLKSNSYASELVTIVSGVSEEEETTFDTYRIISGKGEKDTRVVIRHFGEDNGLNKVSIKKIGYSEIFFETFKLDIGTNKIQFDVSYMNDNEILEYIINRKDNQILKRLLNTNLILK